MQEGRTCALIRSVTAKVHARGDRHRGIDPPPRWALTDAELRVVRQLAKGMCPLEIAASLGLSVHTIRTHLKRAMGKAAVHSQAALIARIYSSGLHDKRADTPYG